MKILRVLAPDADEALARSVRDAVQSFNRGLDIRLRFLSIGVEDSELRVDDPESAAERVGAQVATDRPSVVLVQGDDTSALAAVTMAARSTAVVVHLCAGVRTGPRADSARAIDRLSGVLLAVGVDALAALEAEGLGARTTPLRPGTDIGHQVIKALRAARLARGGDSTC